MNIPKPLSDCRVGDLGITATANLLDLKDLVDMSSVQEVTDIFGSIALTGAREDEV